MRQQHTLETLSGFHEGAVASSNLKSSWNFTTAGAAIADVVTNKTQNTSGTVVSVVDDNTLETTISFQPGDFFEVTLATAWNVVSNIGPVYELICKLCGKAVKRDELESNDGRCSACYDPPRES